MLVTWTTMHYRVAVVTSFVTEPHESRGKRPLQITTTATTSKHHRINGDAQFLKWVHYSVSTVNSDAVCKLLLWNILTPAITLTHCEWHSIEWDIMGNRGGPLPVKAPMKISRVRLFFHHGGSENEKDKVEGVATS